MMTLEQIIPLLQLAIAPVILISGAGLVLLSMTNRYGRVIDRSRIIAEALRQEGGDQSRLRNQLDILARRARLLRLAIILTATSILLAALLVIILFLMALLSLNTSALIVLVFTGCMLTLVSGLVVFIVDLNASLAALNLEIGS